MKGYPNDELQTVYRFVLEVMKSHKVKCVCLFAKLKL